MSHWLPVWRCGIHYLLYWLRFLYQWLIFFNFGVFLGKNILKLVYEPMQIINFPIEAKDHLLQSLKLFHGNLWRTGQILINDTLETFMMRRRRRGVIFLRLRIVHSLWDWRLRIFKVIVGEELLNVLLNILHDLKVQLFASRAISPLLVAEAWAWNVIIILIVIIARQRDVQLQLLI